VPGPALADVVAGIARHVDAGLATEGEALELHVALGAGAAQPQGRELRARVCRHETDEDLTRLADEKRSAAALVGADREARRGRADDRRPGQRHAVVDGGDPGRNHSRAEPCVARGPPDRLRRNERRISGQRLAEADLPEERGPVALTVLLVERPEAGHRARLDGDVLDLEHPRDLVAPATGPVDIDARPPSAAKRRALGVQIETLVERLSVRGGELHRVAVALCASGDVDGQVARVAGDRDRAVPGVEETRLAATDPVMAVAQHDDEGSRRR
jgi:hypothetical protein